MAGPKKILKRIAGHKVAEMYGITFTEAELTLLASDPALLNPYDKQRDYLLRMALRPESCPACKHTLCQRSAWTGKHIDQPGARWPGSSEPIDTSWTDDGADGDLFACPACKARLVHRISIEESDHWMELAPSRARSVPQDGLASGWRLQIGNFRFSGEQQVSPTPPPFADLGCLRVTNL